LDRDTAAGREQAHEAAAHPDAVVPGPPALAGAEFAAALIFEQGRDVAAPLAGQSAGRQAAAGCRTALAQWELPVLMSAAEPLAETESENREQNWLAGCRQGQLRALAPEAGVAPRALGEFQGTPMQRELAAQTAEYRERASMAPQAAVAAR